MEIVLDDSGYIGAPQDQNSLTLIDSNQQSSFELGVSMAIHRWDTLSTAVENNWGGPQSSEKRDWITGLVIDTFNQSKELDIIFIHELLSNAMEDEFDVVVEDQSTVIVAQNIIKIYNECKQNNFTTVHQLYERWLQKEQYRQQHGLSQSNKVHITEDPANPDVSDSEDDSEEDEDDDMMDVENVYIPRQREEPIVDDDGFTVVTKKGGRR